MHAGRSLRLPAVRGLPLTAGRTLHLAWRVVPPRLPGLLCPGQLRRVLRPTVLALLTPTTRLLPKLRLPRLVLLPARLIRLLCLPVLHLPRLLRLSVLLRLPVRISVLRLSGLCLQVLWSLSGLLRPRLPRRRLLAQLPLRPRLLSLRLPVLPSRLLPAELLRTLLLRSLLLGNLLLRPGLLLTLRCRVLRTLLLIRVRLSPPLPRSPVGARRGRRRRRRSRRLPKQRIRRPIRLLPGRLRVMRR